MKYEKRPEHVLSPAARIISASRRTDIPAFYSEWFMNRIRAGYVRVPNPFNPKQVSTVALKPETVAAIAFCTKDHRPLLPRLAELDERGFRYWFQVTLTGLPRIFEPRVPEPGEIVQGMRELAERIGRERVVWRFDPILLSAATPAERIVETFSMLARELEGATRRVIVSFAKPYRQIAARLGSAPPPRFLAAEELLREGGRIASRLTAAAAARGMSISSCAEGTDLTPFGVPPGSCIDAALVRELFGISVSGARDRGQRKECGCARSVDIGIYGTCPHRCLYCYASSDRRLLREAHDPAADSLLPLPPPDPTQDGLFE